MGGIQQLLCSAISESDLILNKKTLHKNAGFRISVDSCTSSYEILISRLNFASFSFFGKVSLSIPTL